MISRQEIAAACISFQRDTRLSVSKNAQSIIEDLINAVEIDPHPNWGTTAPQLAHATREFAQRLPEYLKSIARTENVRTAITTFDVLHWFGTNLVTLCPFSK